MKAGKADITILGGSGDGHLVHVTVAQKELGGSERFTLDSLNMQKDDVLNLHIQGDPGDTLQVYFYYIDGDGDYNSTIVGGLGGTVLDSSGKKTVSFTAPNTLDYVTVKVVYNLSTPTYSASVDYKHTPITTTTTTTTTKPTTTTTRTTTTTTKPTTTTTKTTTTTTTTTTEQVNVPTKTITWGHDNWNFYNSDDNGDFRSTSYRQQMLSSYQDTLKNALTNSEYEIIFNGYTDSHGYYHQAWIDETWGVMLWNVINYPFITGRIASLFQVPK